MTPVVTVLLSLPWRCWLWQRRYLMCSGASANRRMPAASPSDDRDPAPALRWLVAVLQRPADGRNRPVAVVQLTGTHPIKVGNVSDEAPTPDGGWRQRSGSTQRETITAVPWNTLPELVWIIEISPAFGEMNRSKLGPPANVRVPEQPPPAGTMSATVYVPIPPGGV